MKYIIGFQNSVSAVASFILFLFLPAVPDGQNTELKFTHFYVEMPLEPSSYGTGGFSANGTSATGEMN